MKADWDKLGDKYEASGSVLIADVDCTVETEVGTEYDVKGYPTIKYFTADTGKKGTDYSGGRSYEALEKFVTDTLEAKCDVADPKECTEKEVKFIEKMKAAGEADVAKQLKRLDDMKSGAMKPALKAWLMQRLNILKQL